MPDAALSPTHGLAHSVLAGLSWEAGTVSSSPYNTDEETEAQEVKNFPAGSQAADIGPGLEARWSGAGCKAQCCGSPTFPPTTPRGRNAASLPA